MRRKEREIKEMADILAVLDKSEVIRVAFADGDMPYIVPMCFGVCADGDKIEIYMHSAAEGRKMDIIAKNSKVCFEADCTFEVIKGAVPCRWSADFESVVGDGAISVVTDIEEKKKGLDAVMRKYGYFGEAAYGEASLKSVAVLKISVAAMSGKSTLLGKF